MGQAINNVQRRSVEEYFPCFIFLKIINQKLTQSILHLQQPLLKVNDEGFGDKGTNRLWLMLDDVFVQFLLVGDLGMVDEVVGGDSNQFLPQTVLSDELGTLVPNERRTFLAKNLDISKDFKDLFN